MVEEIGIMKAINMRWNSFLYYLYKSRREERKQELDK